MPQANISLDQYNCALYNVDMTTTQGNTMTDGWTIRDDYGNEVQLPGRFADVMHVKAANVNAGQHWFDASSMRFFDSRVMNTGRVYFGRLFISSEREPWADESGRRPARRYTIRCANDDGSISTVGEFQAFKSAAAAERAIFTQYGPKEEGR